MFFAGMALGAVAGTAFGIGLCRFVDGKQVDVNGQVWETGEFLHQMERRGIRVYPLETAEKKER